MDAVVVITFVLTTLVLYGISLAIYRRSARSGRDRPRRTQTFQRRYRQAAVALTICFSLVAIIGVASSSTAVFVVGFGVASGSFMCLVIARDEPSSKREGHAVSRPLPEDASPRFYLAGSVAVLLGGAAGVLMANGKQLVSIPLALGAAALAIYAGLSNRRQTKA